MKHYTREIPLVFAFDIAPPHGHQTEPTDGVMRAPHAVSLYKYYAGLFLFQARKSLPVICLINCVSVMLLASDCNTGIHSDDLTIEARRTEPAHRAGALDG
jgi:hypothetical protein